MKISPARTAAFDALKKIEIDRAFSAVVLPAVEENLSPKDASLCHELVLGALRRKLYIDRVIDSLTDGKKLDMAVRVALQLGIYQLLFLDKVPPHAAINESVELVQRAKKTSAKGFVNAVLRRAQKQEPKLQFASETERIAIETSHPEWMIKKWIGQFGVESAAALAEANNRAPSIAFRRTARGMDSKEQDAFEKSPYSASSFISDKMTPDLLRLADEGLIYFQDEGSQMVAESMPIGTKFLDVCAAPGGKTAQIASKLNRKMAVAVAGDLYWPRVEFLRDNCRRQGIDFVNIVQYDAENSLPFAEGSFDSILVDAPCSGTGTIRHNPEIRYFIQREDFAELSNKQLQILENASKLLTKGGTLVYSTCSLEREENEEVCERFLSRNVGFRKVEPNTPEPFLTDEGYGRTLPHRDNMDGFFIAVFRQT